MLARHIEPRIVALRNSRLLRFGVDALQRLAETIKYPNYRLIAEDGLIHLLSAGIHLNDADPFALFDKLRLLEPKNLDASHAFYLGYEMAKAATALALGKDYRQDQALDWGYLTVAEQSHRLKKTPQMPGGEREERANDDEPREGDE